MMAPATQRKETKMLNKVKSAIAVPVVSGAVLPGVVVLVVTAASFATHVA
jgi:hypothetical protein